MFRIGSNLLALTLALSSFPLLGHAQLSATSGAVFVMTNDSSSNQIIAYQAKCGWISNRSPLLRHRRTR